MAFVIVKRLVPAVLERAETGLRPPVVVETAGLECKSSAWKLLDRELVDLWAGWVGLMPDAVGSIPPFAVERPYPNSSTLVVADAE